MKLRRSGPVLLGILMLETRFPRPLGDVGHPGTFAFPVRRKVVRGSTPQRVVRADDVAELQPFITVARELVAEGCDAISTSCGFLARWQVQLQAALPVPVWTSALLQLAPLQASGRHCGVITIEAASLLPAHLQGVGADPSTVVEGITPGSALHRTLLHDLATLDEEDAQQQVLAAAGRLLTRHPGLECLVLECTNLPPYAPALRAATGLTVLDIVTLLDRHMEQPGRR